MLLLIGVLLLNVLISVWNCYAVGIVWKDTMTIGNSFDKVLLYSGIIQSTVGFSMPILLVLAFGAVSYLTNGEAPYLSVEEGKILLQGIMSLWYVAVILPILGSGLTIWIHSIREAYRRRDFSSIAAAGWNSFAQIHNTISAFKNIGGALSNVGDLFGSTLSSKGDSKGKVLILAVLIVIISLLAGFFLTIFLVKYFSSRSESRIEEYAESIAK